MANICEYKVIVKGRKNACYAFFGSMSCLDDKRIIDEDGSDEEFTMHFEGDCKWAVDSYCEPWEGECPVQLPDDCDEALAEAEDKYWYKTVRDRSRMFDVEVLCCSADIDDPVEDYFEHYISGDSVYDECPKELEVIGSPEEGYVRCVSCGDEIPEEESFSDDGELHFCERCYDEYFGDESAEECEANAEEPAAEEVAEEPAVEEAVAEEAVEEPAVEEVAAEEVAEEPAIEEVAEEPAAEEAAEETAVEEIKEEPAAEPAPECACAECCAEAETSAGEKSSPADSAAAKGGKSWIAWLIVAIAAAAFLAAYIGFEPVMTAVNGFINGVLGIGQS